MYCFFICSFQSIQKKNNTFLTHKYTSDDNELAGVKIFRHKQKHDGNISILHFRWRTVSEKNNRNSHSHFNMTNTFSLVHNVIIENYTKLKIFLIKNNYIIFSQKQALK
jgi:glucosamine 6-phosphate synthetase-like amidotransferase/phosphosugar isomerase protein